MRLVPKCLCRAERLQEPLLGLKFAVRVKEFAVRVLSSGLGFGVLGLDRGGVVEG